MKQSSSNTLSSQSGSTAYRLQARPAPTGPRQRLTAMPHPKLPFNGLHLRNPCNLRGSLLIYRPQRDGRLSSPTWMTHSGRLTHEVVTRQPWIRRRSGKVHWLQTDLLTTEHKDLPLCHGTSARPLSLSLLFAVLERSLRVLHRPTDTHLFARQSTSRHL